MIRIKDGHDAAIKALKKGDFKPITKIGDRNNTIMTELFNRTKDGTIKGFSLISDKRFLAYHRSPKEPGKIQLSSGIYKNGELLPCYDCQFETAAELIKEGFPSGNYQIIA